MIPNEKFLENLTDWQLECLAAYDSGRYRFFILEWARRHRKTTLLINILIRECVEIPNTVAIYLAPYLAQAREIVWDDPNMLFSYLPDQDECGWAKNESKLTIKFQSGSILRVCGADELDRRRGVDCSVLGIDEWSAMKERMWTEIFMPIMAGKGRKRKTLFLYTPKGANHATAMFDWAACINEQGQVLPIRGVAKKLKPGWWASRVINDATDFLDAEFLNLARERWPKATRDQEINCARITDEEMVLITSRMIDDLKGYNIHPTKTRHIISCDPSLGGDACPIQYIRNGMVKDKLVLHERKPMIITGHIIAMMTKHKCEDAIVDATGITVGKAIVDRMKEQGKTRVYGFESAGQAQDPKRFYNRRAEIAWYVSEQIDAH
jgi:hypothetical protein